MFGLFVVGFLIVLVEVIICIGVVLIVDIVRVGWGSVFKLVLYDFVLLGGFDVGKYVLLWFWWGDCVSFGVIEVFGFDILMIGFVCVMFVVMIFWFFVGDVKGL